ncbi:MAG TPA: SMC family ATPase [Thermoplasmata archaeon]|nr:SMC family ATPase [Thermoplasmata archaeon]
MRISYLELRNYRRFRRLRLQFPDGIIGILGLNGSGKTTLIEGIAWALFGNVDEVVRTSRDGIKRLGSGPKETVSAVLEFELDDSEYRIEREMGGKNLTMKARLKMKTSVLAEGDRAVREKIESLIGMDHKSFFTSVFARQKELNALQNIAPGERKKAVLRMLRIDGIDDALAQVREHRRDRMERIKGAENTLVDADGNDRKAAFLKTVPLLEASLDGEQRRLIELDEVEKRASVEADAARKRRDELRADVDAYNAASKDLAGIVSSLKEMRLRDQRLVSTIDRVHALIKRLPELEDSERLWKETAQRKEEMELARGRSERAANLEDAIEGLENELKAAVDELTTLASEKAKLSDVDPRLEEAEKARREGDIQRSDIAKRLGELDSTARSRRAEADRDRSRLDGIIGSGREGLCPTCERTLHDAYDLLVEKLTETVRTASSSITEVEGEMERVNQELRGLARREEALAKKTKHLKAERDRLSRLDSTVQAKEEMRERVSEKLAQKRKERADLGKVDFSKTEYEKVKAAHAEHQRSHDDFVRAKNSQEEKALAEKELDELRGSIRSVELREKAGRGLVVALESNNALYDESIKHLDERTRLLNSAKDASRGAEAERDRRQAELDLARSGLEEIRRVEATIESERGMIEELALLQEVIASFKTYLIGKVAPALSETTAHMLDLMTGGRYTSVELDDNYEIQIDDQGSRHPLDRFSGGESDLANLSLRLAISRIIADRTGANPMNFLILDEIFGSLDPSRKRNVMSALVGISGQFRQIFLITHIEEVKDLMNHVIMVEEQQDGTSSAELLD